MLTPFNRIYPLELDINSLYYPHDTLGIFTNGDRHTSTLKITFTDRGKPFDLSDTTIHALIRDKDGDVYKQDAVLIDGPNGIVGVDIKTDALILGINTMALRISKDNGDVMYSPLLTYEVVETLLDGKPIHTRLKTIKELEIENESLRRELFLLKEKLSKYE